MRTFSVKNFDSFQHYKDRKPLWIKLYNELLDDYDFGRLPDASKAHLIAIWLLASRYENRVPCDAEWVSRRINATNRVDLDLLINSGFLIVDQSCSNVLAEPEQVASLETETETDIRSFAREDDPPPLDANGRSGVDAEFAAFMDAYPEKVGKRDARIAFPAARRKATLPEILTGLDHYIRAKPPDRQWMAPAKFLTDERWTDRYAEPSADQTSKPNRRPESGTDAFARALAKRTGGGDPNGGHDGLSPVKPFADGRTADADRGGGVVIDLKPVASG